MSNTKLVKIYGNDEYMNLLDALDQKDYHWLSGQRAANPPWFFRRMTETDGITDVIGVRCISIEKKTIGYYPLEVFTNSEKQKILESCCSVNDIISIISDTKNSVNETF